MRLNQVKLAGFKSFVDPTVFQLSNQLVGIVGPNGCGKSNIIDAVRWVLGESKASELRGETMQDVIFNGAGQRKPASRASVELVFSNESGRIAGHWGQFSELAVKRVLSREGSSQYYLNNQLVRRRDIQDIFMGTGLGTRAYAIIGQGMINRIIEAKPDELRVFLEEAAGISKYKERRRETALRLNDTRENLLRVADVVQELSQQLVKLTEQAQVATEYTTLKKQLQLQQAVLAFLRQQAAEHERQTLALNIESAQADTDTAVAALHQQEQLLIELRQQHHQVNDALQLAQSAVFTATSRVAQLEADQRLYTERQQQLKAELARQTAEQVLWEGRQVQANQQQSQYQTQLQALTELLEMQQAALKEAQAHTEDTTLAQDEAQAVLNQVRLDGAEIQIQHRSQLTKRQALEGNQRTIQHSLSRLQHTQTVLNRPDSQELSALQDSLFNAQQTIQALQQQVNQSVDIEQTALSAVETTQLIYQQQQLELHTLEVRYAALDTVHQQMYASSHLQSWLKAQGLADIPRFWQHLRVNQGWDKAVQSVLRHRAQALYSDTVHQSVIATLIDSLTLDNTPPATLTLIDNAVGNQLNQPSSVPSWSVPTLLSQIQFQNEALRHVAQCWFSGVYCAESLNAAITQRYQLPMGATWVTPEGHRVDAVSVQLFAPDTLEDNALARHSEVEQLSAQIKTKQQATDQAQADLIAVQQHLTAIKRTVADGQQELSHTIQQAHQVELKALHLQQAVQQYENKTQQLQADEVEHITQLEAINQQLFELDDGLTVLDSQLRAQQSSVDAASEALNHAQQAVNKQRQQEQLAYNAVQEINYQQRSISERLHEAQRTELLAAEHLSTVLQTQLNTQQALDALNNTVTPHEVSSALATRVEAERVLSEKRQAIETLTVAVRQQEERRLQLERRIEPLRQAVVAAQLKEQAARLSVEQFTAQLSELQVNHAAINEWLMHQTQQNVPTPNTVASNIAALQTRMRGLGAVNLAALEELKAVESRYAYLNTQVDDLSSAVATLEEAIATMDGETKQLLQTTFKQVNQQFGELFPQLFGGGQARLLMAGDDILSAGIQVLAHPPGKRNSSIHLLSGGEKALTATALVFAIFQLNPAPFCLLDEVDAPLDDSNTARFADMVTRMAQHTQFVFISHNKIAMEMAQQLIGVTMQEQGISRIVSVDMQAAHVV